MAIYRCNKCGYLSELSSEGVGTSMNCPQCSHPNSVFDTTFFVKKLLEKYFALLASQKRMQAEENSQEASATPETPSLDGVNLSNTDQIATDLQHGPIHDWFEARKIQFQPNYKAVDTTGFFDEIATELGNNFDLLKIVVEPIRHAQRIGKPGIYVNLSQRSQNEAKVLTAFCRRLYDYAFVAKYFYQKEQKTIQLTLQSSQQIQRFFNGEWLEWYALMQVLEFAQKNRKNLSCARNLTLAFPNEDKHELDVFFTLNGNNAVCIECKTGEFRPSIEKYVTLKKRLGLDKGRFVICVLGLPEEQAKGLSSMYDLTFVSESGLAGHLDSLL
jgi:hypothetical protein